MHYRLPKTATDLSSVPNNTTSLDCNECVQLKSLAGLPETLETLNCSDCDGLTSLDLPSSLVAPAIGHCAECEVRP